MPLSYGLGKAYLKEYERLNPGLLTPADRVQVKLGLLIHDQGEAIIGDITYSEKTALNEATEHEAFAQHADRFCPGGSVSLRKAIADARDNVVFGQDTLSGRIRQEVEDLGYLRTALRATRHVAKNTLADNRIAMGLRWLAADVLINKGAVYLEHADDASSPLGAYVQANAPAITEAFAIPQPHDFECYGSQQAQKYDAFTQNALDWHEWRKEKAA